MRLVGGKSLNLIFKIDLLTLNWYYLRARRDNLDLDLRVGPEEGKG